MDTKELVNQTIAKISENASADHEIVDSAHARRDASLPPHLQDLGIDTSAAQKARDRMQRTDRNLSSIPPFTKP